MDDYNTEKLIELVKSNDVLWNLCNSNYKNIKRKAEAWKMISEECGATIETCKKKWKGLRDSYSREINKKKTSGQGADEPAQCWKFRESMDFLKQHMQPRQTVCNYTLTEDISYGACESFPETPNNADEENDFIISPTEPDLDSFHAPSSSRAAKKQKVSVEQSLVSTMKSVQDFLARPRPSMQTFTPPSSFDAEDEHYCRSLVEKLKKFPLKEKNLAKLDIMHYLCEKEAELS